MIETLSAGGASVSEPWSDAPAAWSCGMEDEGGARSASAAFSAQNASVKPIERHQEVAEAMSRGAQLHEGTSKPAVDIVAFRSCGTRVAFAAMNIAACAGAKPARKPNVVFTLLWQHFADRASKV